MPPVHKEPLRLVLDAPPQVVAGEPLAAGFDAEGNPAVWFVASGAPHAVRVTFTGDQAPHGMQHMGALVIDDLVLHVWRAAP